jgi:hypothetical protein
VRSDPPRLLAVAPKGREGQVQGGPSAYWSVLRVYPDTLLALVTKSY